MAQQKKIRILENGPYEVSGDIPLVQAVIGVDETGCSTAWEEGRSYKTPHDPYLLCRCGHSYQKPFCDGSHYESGFVGEERAGHPAYLEGALLYTGKTIDLLDNESLCASMRFCDRGVGVWQAVIDSDDPDNVQLAVEEACSCAAGRLTVVDKAGKPVEQHLPQEISPVEDTAAGCRGPLWVKGGIALEGADGTPYEMRNRMTLCRCGRSQNMPYCDISHMQNPHMQGFDE